MAAKVLFILKFRDNYGPYDYDYDDDPYGNDLYSNPYGYGGLSSGLLNSAIFVADMLVAQGINAKIVQVVDNNSIDKEVAEFQPTHVIIEALWVVPDKFDILQKLHPTVKWIVRTHSEVPFFANEGVAMGWLTSYVKFANVSVAANSDKSLSDLRAIISAAHPEWSIAQVHEKVLFLPNFYPTQAKRALKAPNNIIDVACFGAIRPLKNQLIQAVAAMRYATLAGQNLRFHINSSRTEQNGGNILKNLRALFAALGTGYELVEHDWLPHDQFLDLLATMDLLLQVSFSETFNIVTADAVAIGLPVVVSAEVVWVSSDSQALTTDSEDMVQKMMMVTDWRFRSLLAADNLSGLNLYCGRSEKLWITYLQP